MDINSLHTLDSHETGAEMQVEAADGEKLDCFITFVGLDSHKWRELDRQMQREILLCKGKNVDAITDRCMAEAAISWRGFEENGKELEFSTERLHELFTNAPYIKEQANQFIGTRGNFTPK